MDAANRDENLVRGLFYVRNPSLVKTVVIGGVIGAKTSSMISLETITL